jgi:RIO kinase 1
MDSSDSCSSQESHSIAYDDQWFETNGDLTKKFNRMRNQIITLTGIKTDHKMSLKGQILNRMANQKNLTLPKLSDSIQIQNDENHIKFTSRIKLDANDLFNYKVSSKKEDDGKYLFKDKADRATVEQVLDPRTKMILFKMLNRDIIFEINGCISTGKEANVYHATTSQNENRAIKIYKTSILVFKDRDRYVSGEHRFRHGYSSKNPRKMVQTWAEKEMRNLKRLHSSRIPCPEPLLLRLHVLLMSFIGDKGGR